MLSVSCHVKIVQLAPTEKPFGPFPPKHYKIFSLGLHLFFTIAAAGLLFQSLSPVYGQSADDSPTSSSASAEKQITSNGIQSLMVLFENGDHRTFLNNSEAYLTANPSCSQEDKILFYQMKALRTEKKWVQARAKANKLVGKHPHSVFAQQLGGVGGKTEDQAAFDFTALSHDYAAHRFAECAAKAETFLTNYPNNWRKSDVYTQWYSSLYHAKDYNRFFSLTDGLLANAGNASKCKYIHFLRAAAKAKQGQHVEAQKAAQALLSSCGNSTLRARIQDLRMECLFKQKEIASLAKEADAVTQRATTGTQEQAIAWLWLGIARAQLTPPDMKGAAFAFDTVISLDHAPIAGLGHLPTHAAQWRITVAQLQKDPETALRCIEKLRKMPDSTLKHQVLTGFSYLESTTAAK